MAKHHANTERLLFANVVMQDFETRLRDAFGQIIDEALGIKLLDAAYYVDDFRLVVQIPRTDPGLAEGEVGDAIYAWLRIAQTGFSLHGLVDRIAQQGVSPEFLSRLEACSPSTATALWEAVKPAAGNALTKMAERLGLEPRRASDTTTFLADLASLELNPFFTEPNLLHFAHWSFGLPEDTFDTPLTPWLTGTGSENTPPDGTWKTPPAGWLNCKPPI